MRLSVAILVFTAYLLAILCAQCGSSGSGKGKGNTGTGLTWFSPSPPSPAMKECQAGVSPRPCSAGETPINAEEKKKWFYDTEDKDCVSYKRYNAKDTNYCMTYEPKKDFSSKEECQKYCK